MKKFSFLFENLLNESNPASASGGLPFFWMVIYHEGIRSNHLIFDHKDVEKFEKDRTGTAPLDGIIDTRNLSDLMCELLSCSDIDSAREKINILPYRIRKQMYRVYLCLLERWRHQIKDSLN